MKGKVDYELFYDILLKLREEFHRSGRFDDANSKLDEVTKILVLGYFEALQGNDFNLEFVKEFSLRTYGDESYIAQSLRRLFEERVQDSIFINNDGTNIFGPNPTLNIQPSENGFAETLIREVSRINYSGLIENGSYADFDIFNECFGHFVRDNFRNNKEDAQYMTPAEIAQPIVEMVLQDLIKEDRLIERLRKNACDFVVIDPTCGVGTLLIEVVKGLTSLVDSLDIDDEEKEKIVAQIKKYGIHGQDKVDRMVRLSKINMLFIGAEISNISVGNSISGESRIDEFAEAVDLIITNPPFGAEYQLDLLDRDKYPILSSIVHNQTTVNSELALLDRCLTLLKPGGRLVIVLPDSVVSAKGMYEQFRNELIKTCEIKAVVELPAVTFAQAGTRTKTVVLYIRKVKPEISKIFMAVCNDIGYTVKERTGVPVKISEGTNEMKRVAEEYINYCHHKGGKPEILSCEPSVAIVPYHNLIDNVLNPSFYNVDRLSILDTLANLNSNGYQLKKLGDLAEFVTKERKSYYADEEIKHISVLHVNSDGTIDFRQVKDFVPVSKGRACEPGDVIFSRINPRIPRIAVIIETEYKLVCSNEFEILKARQGINPYFLAAVLRLPGVSQQILNLTSGTSSSHSRIKTDQLKEVLIPLPTADEDIRKIEDISRAIQHSISMKYEGEEILNQKITQLEDILFNN